jgi:hypothetical protein
MHFEKSAIEEIINKIVSIEIDDNVIFEIDKNMINKIYGGVVYEVK